MNKLKQQNLGSDDFTRGVKEGAETNTIDL